MTDIVKHEDGTIEIPVWYSNGHMRIRRECLEADHPEQTYNYLKRNGIVPEDYGIYHPDVEAAEEYMNWSKERLIAEIINLKKEFEAAIKAGF